MTDNDIIKALEHCVSSTGSEACDGCPFNENNICEKEYNSTEKYALDLINRQKGEIENQNAKIDNLIEWLDHRAETIRGLTDELKTAQAEVERLQAEAQMADGYEDALVEMTKSKTITEIAERLKAKKIKPEFPWDDFYVTESTIDQIAKEMKEGVNNA